MPSGALKAVTAPALVAAPPLASRLRRLGIPDMPADAGLSDLARIDREMAILDALVARATRAKERLERKALRATGVVTAPAMVGRDARWWSSALMLLLAADTEFDD